MPTNAEKEHIIALLAQTSDFAHMHVFRWPRSGIQIRTSAIRHLGQRARVDLQPGGGTSEPRETLHQKVKLCRYRWQTVAQNTGIPGLYLKGWSTGAHFHRLPKTGRIQVD